MKIKKVLFSMLFIILCIGMLNYCSGESEEKKSNSCLNFTYNEKSYSIEVEKIAKENNINLEDYPYYLIAKETQYSSSSILIQYSQKKFVGSKDSVYSAYKINGSESTFEIKINSDGSLTGRFVDLSESYFMLYDDSFIASNHDILSGETIIYNKNYGYEYNSSQENGKSCEDIIEVNNETYENINFTYNEKDYSIEVGKIAKENNINLEDYPYYLIAKETQYSSSSILIQYSQKRFVGAKDPVYSAYRINGSESTFRIKINSDGSLTGSFVNLSESYFMLYNGSFIASNHDILSGETIIYNKNHGYEYESSQENGKSCEDIMKVTKKTIVYEKAAINYNEITTLSSRDIVKRIAYSVNIINGHTWDKVVLSNGTEGYVFADNLEIATEYENINFEYNKKNYNIYFSPSRYGVNMEDYPYYFVRKNSSSVLIYCTSKKLAASKDPVYPAYRFYTNEVLFAIEIRANGSVNAGFIDFSKSRYFMVYGSDFIATNYDIYKGNEVLWSKNCGYLDADYISNAGLYFSTNSEGNYNIDLKAEANIIEGELEYNSVSITDEEREEALKKRDLGIKLAYLAYNAQMKDAANNLLYFLTSGEEKYDSETRNIHSYEEGYYKTGHTAKEILFENAIRDMSEPKETLNSSINSMIEATENIIIKDTDEQPIYCYTEINAQCPAPNLNWFMAVNNYRTRGSAVVSREGNSYTMNFKYMMIDYYDWEEAEGIKNWDPYLGAQTEFSKLNKYGLSRNYTNYDILNYTVTWTQGQRVGNGATVSGPGL